MAGMGYDRLEDRDEVVGSRMQRALESETYEEDDVVPALSCGCCVIAPSHDCARHGEWHFEGRTVSIMPTRTLEEDVPF